MNWCNLGFHSYDNWQIFYKQYEMYGGLLMGDMRGKSIGQTQEKWQRHICKNCGYTQEVKLPE